MARRQIPETDEPAASLLLGAARPPRVGQVAERRRAQALRQEDAAFDRDLRRDDSLSLQAKVMGWLLVPGLALPVVLAVAAGPVAAGAAAPVSILAGWYWRRTLARALRPLEPRTPHKAATGDMPETPT
jgi:hypothetical protein